MYFKSMSLIVAAVGFNLTAFGQIPDFYQEKLASEKQEYLFQMSSKDQYTDEEIASLKYPGKVESLKLLSTKYLAESFTNPNDEFPKNKTKLIHTFGAVAKIDFKITEESNYTGLFKTGSLGVIRLSLAKSPYPASFAPGFAIKLLVDHEISQNIFAMFKLEGQGGNFNFFANAFETKISEPEDKLLQFLGKRFTKTLIELNSGHDDPTFQSAADLAKVTNKGIAIHPGSVQAPFALVFEPNHQIDMSEESGNFLLRLKDKSKYNKGTVLYTVYTRAYDKAPKKLLGQVVLSSHFVANKFGDKRLYFRHNIK